MLTGMVRPSSGKATVFGYDIDRQFAKAASFIGVCPQHSILYNSLTVKEHLIFYGNVKSKLNGKELREEIEG